MTDPAIIEAAVRALKDNPGTAFQTYQELAEIAVAAVTPLIRAATLEEAALMADKHFSPDDIECFAEKIAAAIRALKEQLARLERSAAPAASKEAGAPGKEIEITPEMIEAGVRVLASEWGVIGEVAAEELAEDVYRAMSAINSRHDFSQGDNSPVFEP